MYLKIFAKIIAFFLYFIWYFQILLLHLIHQTETNKLFANTKKMKANCNITGIEFEATSGRQKNHPEVSQLMNDLNKYEFENYRAVKDALTARKGTFNNIDEVIEFAKSVKASKKEEIFPEDTNTDAVYY